MEKKNKIILTKKDIKEIKEMGMGYTDSEIKKAIRELEQEQGQGNQDKGKEMIEKAYQEYASIKDLKPLKFDKIDILKFSIPQFANAMMRGVCLICYNKSAGYGSFPLCRNCLEEWRRNS